MAKMTLAEFAHQYNHGPYDDEELAQAIVRELPEELPVVKASQAFLEAYKALDEALAAAGIERD
jgi:hypothetical protein